MCVSEKTMFRDFVGDENYDGFMLSFKTGKTTSGHLASPVAEMLDEKCGLFPGDLARKRVNYCKLINSSSPRLLPAVLRFAMKEQHYPFIGLTMKKDKYDGIILEEYMDTPGGLRTILQFLSAATADAPQVLMRLCQGAVTVYPEEHRHDELIIQLSGQSFWYSGSPSESLMLLNDSKNIKSYLAFNENDYLFLPSGSGYQVSHETRLSLSLVFRFERRTSDLRL